MKKLFSFLCLLVLGMSMSAWGEGQISKRQNAAQVDALDTQHAEDQDIWTLIQCQSCVIKRTSAGTNTYNITLYSTSAAYPATTKSIAGEGICYFFHATRGTNRYK